MKILIYTTAFAPSVGGVETYVMLLAKGLGDARIGEEPFSVTVATRTVAGDYDDASLPFAVVRQPGALKLRKLLREADVVHLAGPCLGPLALAWLMRKRIVIEHHGYQAACPNGSFLLEPKKETCPGYFERAHYGKCLRCVSAESGSVRAAWKVLSTFPRRWLTKRVRQNVCVSAYVEARLNLPRSRVIYHGIAPFRNGSSPGAPAHKDGPLVFGYVGRFVSEKSLITLIEAARALAEARFEFRLKFVGDGAERTRLETAAQASGLAQRTTFTGFLTGEALSEAVAEISVLVIPTISEETFGMSALEYMAQGKAVIAADIGGLSEVVNGAGLKFKPGNATGLAREMQRLLEDPALLLEFGKKAKQRASAFTLEQMIGRHVELYRELAAA
jgi:glycosyltransferase involved in cell wall biosynthesis